MSDQITAVHAAMKRLDDHIHQMAGLFKKFSAGELTYKSAPGKWSRIEILGHLIDSAINNLKRFTEIQFLPQPYKVIPYRQDDLVTVNQYQHLPLAHLLHLWSALNRQIIYTVKNIPGDRFSYVIEPYDSKEMKSFGWLICDYVDHIEHHLKQL